jgi:hypothetical protein
MLSRSSYAVPDGTRAAILLYPGTAVPGYKLFRPFGTLLPVVSGVIPPALCQPETESGEK